MRRKHVITPLLSISAFFVLSGRAIAENHPADPFLGDWQGEKLVAQVIPRGAGKYQINLLPEFDVKCEPLAVVEASVADGVLRFDQDGWKGELKGERFIGQRPVARKTVAFELKRVVRTSPRVGAKPPEGAILLFDGFSP